MSKLIVFCGHPGTGKTTLSKELSKKLKITCLHKDSFKEPIYENMGCKSLEDSIKAGYCSIKTLLNVAEDQVKSGIDIIIESPFNHIESVETFKKWIKKYKIDFYCVICSLDEDIRMSRWKNRLKIRHRSHHDNERLQKFSRGINNSFDFEEMPEKKIRITSEIPVPKLIKKILKEIT